eukprot:TRINITY_DN21678_c0_g1_i1.p1 TRINITY_DN21678_c0_g1~~TRINITY_DN21678_c0_g1_i1.p1  ORF type:complete len:336 (-),score=45.96 TRINITY_DN21678_c0_g1_i1:18-893(-)
MTTCYCGVIMNSLLIYLFFSKNREKIVESKEARVLFLSLFVVDFCQGLWIGTVAILNFANKGFIANQQFCNFSALITGFFTFLSLGIMDFMALHLKTRVTVTEKKYLPLKIYYLVLFIIGCIVYPILIYIPGALLESSGIVCVGNYSSYLTIMFFVVMFLMIGFVMQIYFRIFLFYHKITQGSVDSTISTKKKKLIFRFSIMIFLSLCTLGPYGASLIYAWSTGFYPPAAFDLVLLFIWNSTVWLNPIIYCYTNRQAFSVLLFELKLISEVPGNSTHTSKEIQQDTVKVAA